MDCVYPKLNREFNSFAEQYRFVFHIELRLSINVGFVGIITITTVLLLVIHPSIYGGGACKRLRTPDLSHQMYLFLNFQLY